MSKYAVLVQLQAAFHHGLDDVRGAEVVDKASNILGLAQGEVKALGRLCQLVRKKGHRPHNREGANRLNHQPFS